MRRLERGSAGMNESIGKGVNQKSTIEPLHDCIHSARRIFKGGKDTCLGDVPLGRGGGHLRIIFIILFFTAKKSIAHLIASPDGYMNENKE